MRIIPYLRVSTDEQAQHGYGLDAQESALRQEFDRRGWDWMEPFRDEGISAKTLERPALKEALKLIACREADGLAVAKLDRLTRSVVDFARLLEWFQDARATLVALDLQVDTSTPAGRLVATVLASVAEWERDVIAQRTRDGLAARRSRGESMGRPCMSDRPELVARIRAWHLDGWSLRAIATHLNNTAISTVRGGKEWRPSSVQAVLGYKRGRSRTVADLPKIKR